MLLGIRKGGRGNAGKFCGERSFRAYEACSDVGV